MADSDESDGGFVSRWARRKRDAKTAARAEAVAPAPEPSGQVPAEAPSAEIDPAELPDPDTLDAEADFTVFLKEGVPEAVRRRALRRLWRLNPVLANLDGLNDYDDDFTDAATVVEGLKTLYKVGQGMVSEEDETPEEPAESAEAEPAVAEAPATQDGLPKPEDDAEAVAQAPKEELDEGPEEGEATARAPAPDPEPVPAGTQAATRASAPAPGVRRRGALERRWGGSKT